jgi:hypothetical protein
MKKRLVYALALALGAATLSSVNSLRAETTRTQPVNIPYDFHVAKKAMPSGTYRLDQEFGAEIATLVNMKTGERVRVIRSNATRTSGKALFKLIPDKDGYRLKVS